jgi:hypothetical protein
MSDKSQLASLFRLWPVRKPTIAGSKLSVVESWLTRDGLCGARFSSLR